MPASSSERRRRSRPTPRTRRPVNRASGARRPRRPRRSHGMRLLLPAVVIVALTAFFAAAAFAGLGGDSTMEECGSCHTIAETPLFSHERHAAGRECRSCHGDTDHSSATSFRSRLGLSVAAATDAAGVPILTVPAPGVEEPSAVEGHRSVSCSSCHDMRVMSCDSCHQRPQAEHFEQQACTQCHSVERPFSEPSLEHVTFGAHNFADEACTACHDGGAQSPGPSCRSCHGNSCGVGVTTMRGCLECHESGTTAKWLDGSKPVGED
jgi:hypothetical protein